MKKMQLSQIVSEMKRDVCTSGMKNEQQVSEMKRDVCTDQLSKINRRYLEDTYSAHKPLDQDVPSGRASSWCHSQEDPYHMSWDQHKWNQHCRLFNRLHCHKSWPDLLIVDLQVGGVHQVLHILGCVDWLKDLLKCPEEKLWQSPFYSLKQFGFFMKIKTVIDYKLIQFTLEWFLSELVGQWCLASRSFFRSQFARTQTLSRCSPQAPPVTMIIIQ